jgi:hypothetical protein
MFAGGAMLLTTGEGSLLSTSSFLQAKNDNIISAKDKNVFIFVS